MQKQIKGKKLNMTQIFLETGAVIPVTVIGALEPLDIEMVNKSIEIVGTSKGKGFTGAMKKWGFHGEQATRGQSSKPRSAGSLGSQTPGRVYKGKKMAGRHGSKRVTLKGLKIMRVDAEKGQFMVSGPVPGARNSEVTVKVIE